MRVAGAPAANPTIALDSVPLGTFSAIEFGISVDSGANHHSDRKWIAGFWPAALVR